MKRIITYILLAGLMVAGGSQAFSAVIYVDAAATGNNDGTDWIDAYAQLDNAMAEADTGDQIWVAAGTYTPATEIGGTGERYRAFQLKNGVTLLGGFAGSETSVNQRDWKTHRTILSGDIGVFNDPADNCYHVFYHPRNSDIDDTAVLDGFTITGGNADYPLSDFRSGGGMFNYDASPTIQHCTFTDNFAVGSSSSHGGAMFNNNSSPKIVDCVFIDNGTEAYGGAMANIGNSSPTIGTCVFVSNHANPASSRGWGGAIHNANTSSAVFVNCLFDNNTAKLQGGAIHNEGFSSGKPSPRFIGCVFNDNQSTHEHGGAIYNKTVAGSTLFVNCIISNNTAAATGRHGGAMYNQDSSPQMINSVFYNNTAGCVGDGIYNNQFSNPQITNSILWNDQGSPDVLFNVNNSNPAVTYCVVQGGYGDPADNNSDSNPLFVDAAGGDFRVSDDSPCIDTGDNNAVPADIADMNGNGDTTEALPYDIAFKPRIFNDACAVPAVVDIGAYERTSADYGDLDGDCKVDMADFSILAGAWQSGDNRADMAPGLAGPCDVDIEDLATLIESWLEGI